MLKIKRLLSLFFLVFFSILSLHLEPVFSQSPLACFENPAAALECADTGLISPETAANAVRGALTNPSPINPLINLPLPSKELVLVLGGVAALSYLHPSDMQKLKNSAPVSSPKYYLGRWFLAMPNGVRIAGSGDFYPVFPLSTGSALLSHSDFREYLASLGYGWASWKDNNGVYGETTVSQTSAPVWVNVPEAGYPIPAPTPDYSKVSNDTIFAMAAAGAAAAANDSANSDTDRMNAALAAIAAAGLVGAGSPDYPMAQDALNSAKAAADALAAAAAAKEQQDKDKALADKLANPSTLPSKAFSGSTNFVSYAVGAFASKFPFDLIYGATDASIPSCPSFSLFYYKWELCFLMPIFLTIRWIVFISISTKVVLEL